MIKRGFTIAEIMVTLSLVAGMAMLLTPILIADNQKKFLYTALDKTSSDLSQLGKAIDMLQVRGKISQAITERREKTCATGDVTAINGKCYKTTLLVDLDDEIWDTLKTLPDTKALESVPPATQYPLDKTSFTVKVLRNGVFIFVDKTNSQIIVDVNGRKSPNVIGEDIYYFVFDGNQIVPKTGCTAANDLTCNAEKFLKQGKID